ncbi:Suppressor of lurcher protein [Schistosoma japonicum]|nr:Suppressor of lurcher protein [Schistosoma japonicum]
MLENRYTNDGQHVIGTTCDQLIKSPTYEEKSITTMTPNRSTGKLKYGYFFSPRYPQNYPPNIMCNIYLIGQSYERVVINFLDVELKSIENSSDKLPPIGDHLQIYEAKQTISPPTITSDSISYSSSLSSPSTTLNSFYHNQNIQFLQSTEIIQYIYGQITKDVQIISKGPHMLITFISDNDGKQSRGFEAKYRFVHKNQVRPTIKNNHLHTNNNNGEEISKLSNNGELLLRKNPVGGDTSRTLNVVSFDVASEESLSVQHRKTIQWNKDSRSGLIYSPDYPKAYPPNQVNEYVLMAPPKGRVQITVGTFQLDKQKTSSCKSHVGDRIEIYSNANRNIHPWIILCGVQISPEYKFIESLTDYLLLRFISDSMVSNTEKGFQLYYTFVNDNISDSFIDTVAKIKTNATDKNLRSHYNHQESIQLESNLLDEHVYQSRQRSNSIVVSPVALGGNQPIVGNMQGNEVLFSSKKLSQFIHGNSELNTLNRKQQKCSYVIEDNHQQKFLTFQSLNLKETILKHYDSLHQSKTNHDSILCKWILIGRPYKRVQVRLVSKTFLSNNTNGYGRKKHYESFPTFSNQYVSSNQSISMNHHNVNTITSSMYNGPKIGCDAPYLLKILNYRLQSNSKDLRSLSRDFLLSTNYNPKGNFKMSGNNITNDQSVNQLKSTPFAISEQQVSICLGLTLNIDLNTAIYMSGYVPRLNILLFKTSYFTAGQHRQFNTITGYSTTPLLSSRNVKSTEQNNARPIIAYDIEYRFLYDYGVNTSHGTQNLPYCNFSFYSSISKTGYFTSPNYPGLYPIDITCEYQLIGSRDEMIALEFYEFDVESNSVRCSTDGDSDYVEIRSCFTLSVLDLTRKYYCRKIATNNTIHVNWRNPCLIIKFFSNSMIVRHGFLAEYTFLNSKSTGFRMNKFHCIMNVLLIHMFFLLIFTQNL